MKRLYPLLLLFLWPTLLLAQTASVRHEILHAEDAGTFEGRRHQNLNILVPTLGSDPAEIKSAVQLLINEHCTGDKGCNQVYFWRDREAYDQLMFKRENITLDKFRSDVRLWQKKEAAWKKKHWKFVCENLIADYNGVEGVYELGYFPYMDSEYREYGGKKKRPEPTTAKLVPTSSGSESDLASEKAAATERTGVIGGLLLILVLIGVMYLAYRWSISKDRRKTAIVEEYRQALKGSDRARALAAARAYYAMRRGGYLTAADEQAITNDLSTMPAANL